MWSSTSVQFSHSVVSDPLGPHRLQHARPPCPLPTPGVYSNSSPLSQWCHPTISSSVVPFSSCLQSFPAAAAAAKSPQSYLTLCDPIDGTPRGFSVPGILQAGTLEWVAISFSKAWKWKVKVKSLSRVWLLATPWTTAHQVPPSMEFSSQEYWSGVPLPSQFPPSGTFQISQLFTSGSQSTGVSVSTSMNIQDWFLLG